MILNIDKTSLLYSFIVTCEVSFFFVQVPVRALFFILFLILKRLIFNVHNLQLPVNFTRSISQGASGKKVSQIS